MPNTWTVGISGVTYCLFQCTAAWNIWSKIILKKLGFILLYFDLFCVTAIPFYITYCLSCFCLAALNLETLFVPGAEAWNTASNSGNYEEQCSTTACTSVENGIVNAHVLVFQFGIQQIQSGEPHILFCCMILTLSLNSVLIVIICNFSTQWKSILSINTPWHLAANSQITLGLAWENINPTCNLSLANIGIQNRTAYCILANVLCIIQLQ